MIQCLSFYVIVITIVIVNMVMMMMSLLMAVSLEPYLDTQAQWLIVQDQEPWLMIIITIMIWMIMTKRICCQILKQSLKMQLKI